MSNALTKLMNLPVTGFDVNGEETVNREAAAEIVREIEIRLAHAQNVAAAWEDAYTLHREIGSPVKPPMPREPYSWK